MRATRLFGIVTVAAALAASTAQAQVAGELELPGSRDNTWSATAGRTVGNGRGVILGEGGWPGIAIQYSRGLSDESDLGFRASFLYGFEGTTNTLTGMNLAMPYRRSLYDSGRLGITGHMDPGLTFYGNRGPDTGNLFGVGMPVGAVIGYRFDDRITLDVGADLQNLLSFSNPLGVIFAPMVGLGAEYKLDKDVGVTFRSRFGPAFAVVNGGSSGEMAFQTLLGVAYRTP